MTYPKKLNLVTMFLEKWNSVRLMAERVDDEYEGVCFVEITQK